MPAPPAVIMMVGLQGSGKTTTTAKLAKLLREKHGKKALMASLDVNRPAAQEQLRCWASRSALRPCRSSPASSRSISPPRAGIGKLQNFDVLLLDTAGRLHVDDALMAEMKAVAGVSAPTKCCWWSIR
jgi:signal recognition particle subunit SRP54